MSTYHVLVKFSDYDYFGWSAHSRFDGEAAAIDCAVRLCSNNCFAEVWKHDNGDGLLRPKTAQCIYPAVGDAHSLGY